MRERTAGALTAAAWAACFALMAVLFAKTLMALYIRWTDWAEGTYTHGLLVPVFSAFLLWDRKEMIKAAKKEGSLWGAPVLAGAVLVFLAGRMGNMLFAQAAALVAATAGLTLLVGGWGVLRAAAPAIAFLVFMCPLPSSFYDAVSAKLRLLASATSTGILQVSGVAAYREGNIIYLPAKVLSVEDACSGIRSLFGILATATAFAALVPGGAARKGLLVASAAPIAVFTNVMRVTGTGLLQYYGSGRMAEGFYHYLEGWVFYVAALAFLWGEYRLLKVIFPIEERKAQGEAAGGEARR